MWLVNSKKISKNLKIDFPTYLRYACFLQTVRFFAFGFSQIIIISAEP